MGKLFSLIAKGVAIIFAIVAFLVFDKTAGEIVPVALCIAGVFGTVDASMIIKNVKGNK